uniref:Mei2-like C-terminal RNA recognition motif domain-containing protein n=3 Tax=Aegilops tauschii TaxID=37682 RepID=A0A453LEM2_AEGTS
IQGPSRPGGASPSPPRVGPARSSFLLLFPNTNKRKMELAMAAAYTSRLGLSPAAHPYDDASVACALGQLYSTKDPFALPVSCLLPPPELPPAFGLPVGGLAPVCCCAKAAAAPAFPPFPWAHVPSPPAPPRCAITEIDESREVESEDNLSPRSVLTPWRRPTPASALSPPPPLVVGGKRAFDPSSEKTSLMICNIPNGFVKRRFMAILDQHCVQENDNPEWRVVGGGKFVRSEYDFLYIPIDFRTKYNKGYAFVNMTTATAARRLHAFLHGHCWALAGSRKVCEVVHADIQGVDALSAHFSCSKFPCGNKEFLPVRFGPPRDGLRPTVERVIGRTLVHRPSDQSARPTPHAAQRGGKSKPAAVGNKTV